MDPITKALWFIESHQARQLELEDIAQAAGVSRFHLTRVFGQVFGRPVMRYLRGRRLTEAAKALAQGAPDILSVALVAGYGSHEAFTRAFRDEFGLTPEAFRAAPDPTSIPMTEAILMTSQTTIKIDEPRIVDADTMLFAGLGQRFNFDDMVGIPQQWQRFNEYVDNIPGEVPGAAYGVCTNSDANGLDYISAVQVRDFSDLPNEFTRLRVPAQRYAVFTHHGHVSDISKVFKAVFGDWLPGSGREVIDGPTLERYGQAFDPTTGKGGFEVWLPIKA